MYRRFLPDSSHSFGWFCETLVGHNVLQMRRNELKYGFYCQNPACFSNISFNSPAELHGQKIWNTINLIHDDNNNGCVAHWISFALSRQRSRARLPAVRCRCFLRFFFFWKHIGSVLRHQFITENNVTFESKPKQARTHFLSWDYH